MTAVQGDEMHIVFVAAINRSFFKYAVNVPVGPNKTMLTSKTAELYCRAVNEKPETGLILNPYMKISLLPLCIYQSRNSWEDSAYMERNIRDAFKANREYIKSKEMLFVFEQTDDFNSESARFVLDTVVESQIEDPKLESVTYTLM